MSELRQNLATREWVIIASDRARRPTAFADAEPAAPRPRHDPACPFCPGNEAASDEVARTPDEGDWRVRVVHNKYPALRPVGPRTRVTDGIRRQISGVGHHEVVVQSPRHDASLAFLQVEEARTYLEVLQLRAQALAEDERVAHVALFENHGARAGASLVHPHAQVMGIPVVPHDVRNRIVVARSHFDDTGDCVICRMLDEELADGLRIVDQTRHFTSFVPFAAYSPFHLWVVPRRHASSFAAVADADELDDLARILGRTLRRVHAGLNDPDYNYVFRSAPVHEERSPYLHWYIAIVPRVSKAAGFELGSGMFINSALPEASARFLRSIEPDRVSP